MSKVPSWNGPSFVMSSGETGQVVRYTRSVRFEESLKLYHSI
jgi:hypothetical protein